MKTRTTRHPRRAGALLLALVLPVAAAAAPEPAGNPHWKADACESCHSVAAPTAGNLALKTTPGYAVCTSCHDGRKTAVCRHRAGIAVDAARAGEFDAAYTGALDDGQVVCTTCHEMAPHCARDTKSRYRNRTFLRGGPFKSAEEQCFSCHSTRGYRKPSPHMQVKSGEIKEGTCVFCHGAVPQQDAAGQWLPASFDTAEPIEALCTGCHMVGPHPSSSVTGKTGWMHMVVPPPKYAERMQAAVAERGGSLPLDPVSGKITCTTCHNPHDKRLPGYPNSGEDVNQRLRHAPSCGACHEK